MPCILTRATSYGSVLLHSKAALMRTLCAGPFGAVKPLDRPSYDMEVRIY